MATSQKLYYTAIIFLGHFTFVSDFKRSNKVSFNLPLFPHSGNTLWNCRSFSSRLYLPSFFGEE